MADNPWLKALGHGIKALGYAVFTDETDDEAETPTAAERPARRIRAPKAKPQKPGSCCTARRSVPRVRRGSSED